MCTYLAKRNSTYYFRFPIPVALREAMGGKAEIMQSLRTKDKDEAKRLIPGHTLAAQGRLDAAATQQAKSPKSTPTHSPLSAKAVQMERAQFDYDENAAAFFAAEEEEREQRIEAEQKYQAVLEKRMMLSTAELTPYERVIKRMLQDKDFKFSLVMDKLAEYETQISSAKKTGDTDMLAGPRRSKIEIQPAVTITALLRDTFPLAA
jgi:hypothetical protein